MVNIPLGKSDWVRSVANEADIPVINRYFETNPTNLEDQVALLARPGLKRFLQVGEGPIRALYSQPGSFDDALFVVSYDALYRVDKNETVTYIGSGVSGASFSAMPYMAATARLGDTPEYLFVADGRNLWLYVADGYATGTLTATGAIANGYKIQVGTTYYQWTSGSVDTGTPAGTLANPWLVALGASNTTALLNMKNAFGLNGVAGTDYSTAIVANTDVIGSASTPTVLTIRSLFIGTLGNATATVVTSGANISFGAATLAGGGDPSFTTIEVPDNVGVVSVAYIASYVVVVIAQGEGVNGRFYWIDPGETTIHPLNFATAERFPDAIINARTVGDQLWLFGSNSTEIWYPSGDAIAPFVRVQGRLFDRGIWEGTDVPIKDSVILADAEGYVYMVGPGGPRRISNNGIEERIRAAIIDAKQQL